jgi:hypothetical protein
LHKENLAAELALKTKIQFSQSENKEKRIENIRSFCFLIVRSLFLHTSFKYNPLQFCYDILL